MSGYEGASERIVATVTAWPGVEAATGSRGELSLRIGRREIGHLHGDHAAHFGLPKALSTSFTTAAQSTSTRSSPASPASGPAGSRPRPTSTR